MSKYLLLQGYNSYTNRIAKRHNTADEYVANSENWALRENMNFNPNDGVRTQIVYNYTATELCSPNYVVVLDDNATVVSRWFVMEEIRQRNGQIVAILKRDLIADWWDYIIGAPCFIEKATLNYNDPFIFNKENMTYNQIKDENEIFLKDKTETPWIVGYVSTGGTVANSVSSIRVPTVEDIQVASMASAGFVAGQVVLYSGLLCTWSWIAKNKLFSSSYTKYDMNFYGEMTSNPITGQSSGWKAKNSTFADQRRAIKSHVNTSVFNLTSLENYIKNRWSINANAPIMTEQQFRDIYTRDTLYVRALDEDKIYKVSVNVPSNWSISKRTDSYNGASWEAWNTEMVRVGDNAFDIVDLERNYTYEIYSKKATITITEAPATRDINILYPWNMPNKNKLIDAPYCMFAMPLNATKVYKNEANTYYTNPFISLEIATNFASTEACFDLQLVPYCPWPDLWDDVHKQLDISNTDASIGISASTVRDGIYSKEFNYVVLYPKKSNFSFTISKPGGVSYYSKPTDPIQLKVDTETKFWRLVSPNYNGVFEFDPAKNGGVHRFKVDCSYKPGQPYIHVAPDWGGLYGTNINDARGLICGGDFSLPTATNRWLNFELNNKNYQQQFDREIENMEHERSIQKKEQIVQTVTGAVSGAGTGAAMGAMVGGGIGAAVGATLGAGMSIAGGIADLKHAEARFDEAMDYKKDMFGFQLGNIQALPHSLSKVSAYNNNNKIYPFIEKYHATEQEEQALREKIKYNGMTVGRIDKIENFLGIIPNQLSYIKGRPIELNIPEDAHLLTELIIEVNKGIRA